MGEGEVRFGSDFGRQDTLRSGEQEEGQTQEKRTSARVEYGDLQGFMESELSSDSWNELVGQLEALRGMIRKYESLNAGLKEDQGNAPYVDEIEARIRSALSSFRLNGKSVDLREMSDKPDFAGLFNDVVYFANEHQDMYLGGGQRIEEV